MPEVQADRPIADLLVSQTAIFQALAQFTIQSPVLHPLIKAIDSNHRFPRHRGITTIQRRPRGRQVIEHRRGPLSPQRLQQIPRRSQSAPPEPARIHGPATGNVGHLNLLADTRWQAYVTAREDHIGSRQSSVLRQKVFTRDAIAICEYQVVAGRGGNRLVLDRTLAIAQILVPNVLDVDPRFLPQALDQLRRLTRRSVIRHQQLKIGNRLDDVTPNHFFEPLRLVVGADNDGNFIWIDRCTRDLMQP